MTYDQEILIKEEETFDSSTKLLKVNKSPLLQTIVDQVNVVQEPILSVFSLEFKETYIAHLFNINQSDFKKN
ncbi:hypothetical protein GW891_03555 [bacterium]|nr:hypothetical protein [bacterium]